MDVPWWLHALALPSCHPDPRLIAAAADPAPAHLIPSQSSMEPSTTSPAISVAITVLVVLLALTGFGVYTAFGPPSKQLSDPFDDHDD
jgi:PsbN protein